ncbi:MAG: ABC transporter permease [Planctomycetota bacterium]
MRLEKFSVSVGPRKLLADVDAEFPPGITVIVGASGAGKSVLLRCLADLVDPDGPIHTEGTIKKQPGDQVGVVFQDFALLDEFTPLENVRLAIEHRRSPAVANGKPAVANGKPAETQRSANAWLDELRVPIRVPTSKLSGGQKQRLAIARTLASGNPIVLYDEPTSGLDHAAGSQVAELIQQTQRRHGGVSIVVTHDYTTLVPIADQVLLFDPETQSLDKLPSHEIDAVVQRLRPTRADNTGDAKAPVHQFAIDVVDRLTLASGRVLFATLLWPWRTFPWVPYSKWSLRFTVHALRLVAGPSAWIYMILAGMILGFVTNYFTFEFLPYRAYTQPLLMDDLLTSIGFASFRILGPILATILIAARTGAAIASEVGMKRYGGQLDAMRTLGVSPDRSLAMTIQFAMLVTTPLLMLALYAAATWVGWLTFHERHPDIATHYWSYHYGRALGDATGWWWVVGKGVISATGITMIAYHQGKQEKSSAAAISQSITRTILYATLFVLVVHFVVALFEF